MGISQAIRATLLAHGTVSSQAIGDFALQVWRDLKAAEARGDIASALELEQEFQALCELLQEN